MFVTMAIQTVFTFRPKSSPILVDFLFVVLHCGMGQISNYVAAFVLGNDL